MSFRHYLTLGEGARGGAAWQIHYREAGTGAPIVLLHPSPLSSAFMEPLIGLFSPHARAVALDTPGYGQSDPLPPGMPGAGLEPYVEALDRFITNLGLEHPIIYGSATGAQIAIEYAKVHADKTRALLLENAAWFDEEDCERILEGYFPDLSPKPDGSHLQVVWNMVNRLYHSFPWNDESPEALVNTQPVPVEMLQRTVMDYLLAGPGYDRAYRAAFFNERVERLIPVPVPTHIVRWESSLIKKYADRFDEVALPDNIKMHFAGAGVEARFQTLVQVLQGILANE